MATGAVDAVADTGSDTHRLVDLAAALVLVPASGELCELVAASDKRVRR